LKFIGTYDSLTVR